MKSIPPVFYGTAWKKEKTAILVETALKQGFRAIDTACQPKHYN
jgi:diketogulonate reductase-like aldo/keto reductase